MKKPNNRVHLVSGVSRKAYKCAFVDRDKCRKKWELDEWDKEWYRYTEVPSVNHHDHRVDWCDSECEWHENGKH